MFSQDDKPESLTGHIIFDEYLRITESSGQLAQILRKKNIEISGDFTELTAKLKRKTSLLFTNEILPALKERKIKHLNISRRDSRLSISITPISSGSSIVSFDETIQTEKRIELTLPEKLKEVLIRVDPDLKITYVSKNFQDKFRIKTSTILNRKISEIQLFSNNSDTISDLISLAFQQQKQKSDQICIQYNQKNKWYHLLLIPEADPVVLDQSVLIVFRDITKQKLLEEKFKENEQRFELSIEAADLGLWEFNVITGNMSFSKKWKSMLGYYPDELTDEYSSWENLIHPDDKDKTVLLINNFINSDLRIYETEFRLRHKNGNYIWVKSRGTMLRDENGKSIHVFGTHRDISEAKNSESEYTKLYQAITQSPISVIITDKEGYIEYTNPAFCKISGWKDQEVIGKKPNILKSGHQSPAFYDKLWRTISSGNEWQGELKNRKKNGDFFWELASISPIKNNFGTITHYVKIAENISYLKRIEKDLKKAKQDAEAANTYKNHFLANMSHEIRTPINTIIGFSELIKNDSQPSQKMSKYSDIIEENSQSLLRIIDDIIDISKIEANELKIKKEACNLGELFSEFELTFANFLRKKSKQSIELILQLPQEDHHNVIFTDPYRLKQIINNLFLNAMNHTDRGRIKIGYRILNANKIQFFVSDTGSGIPPSQIQNIFKRFSQIDERANTPSSGLGLSISKDLALLLGGDINVKSVEGEGSIFFLTIPYDKIKVTAEKTAPKPSLSSMYNFSDFTIMIAEDTPYNYKYLFSILNKTGANIIWAKDGIDVLKIYNSAKIDLILMDIQLPEINGYEATAQIRQSNQTLPIIAQTAYAMAENKQKCIESGCNEVLIKPIRMDDVLSTLAKYLIKPVSEQ